MQMCPSKYLYWLSGLCGHASVVLVTWNNVTVHRDDIDRNIIVHFGRAENSVFFLKHPKSKKIVGILKKDAYF